MWIKIDSTNRNCMIFSSQICNRARGRADLGVRALMCNLGVVSVTYSRGLLSFGGGGGQGGRRGRCRHHKRDNDEAFPLPPGLDAIEHELERIVKDSLSSFVLLENYLRCMMQIIVR